MIEYGGDGEGLAPCGFKSKIMVGTRIRDPVWGYGTVVLLDSKNVGVEYDEWPDGRAADGLTDGDEGYILRNESHIFSLAALAAAAGPQAAPFRIIDRQILNHRIIESRMSTLPNFRLLMNRVGCGCRRPTGRRPPSAPAALA